MRNAKNIKSSSVKQSYAKSSNKWTHFGWFIFGIIILAGFSIATTINENNIITSGNITADTYFGDGSQLTGISASGVNFNETNASFLWKDLSGFWGFEESDITGNLQTAYDSSFYGNNMTLGNSTPDDISEPIHIDGLRRGSLRFDGLNDYATLDNTAGKIYNNTNFTVSLWLKVDGQGNGTTGFTNILRHGQSNNQIRIDWLNNSLGYGGTVNEYINVTTITGIGTSRINIINNTQIGRWYHIAFTVIRSGEVNAYLNGELFQTTTNAYSSTTLLNMTVGSTDTTKEYLKGDIDEFKFWKRALSANEIRAEYQGLGGSATGQFSLK